MTRSEWTNLCVLGLIRRRPDINPITLMILAELLYDDHPRSTPQRAAAIETLTSIRRRAKR